MNIELIALYVHSKNSNHLRSHSRAIMALDHSRLGLENKFSENKSGPIFCVRQVYNLFYKILLTSLGTCKPAFYTFYTSSEVKQYHGALFLSYRPRTDQFCNINCTHSTFRSIEARVGFYRNR